MSVSSILSLLLAIFRAIPTLKGWFDDLVNLYVQAQIENFKAEVRAGMRKAIEEFDQRELEKTIGAPKAGLPSGNPDTEIVDELPGVPK